MKDDFIWLLSVISFAAAVASFCIALVNWANSRRCEARWGDRGHYTFFSGCMVDTPQGRVPDTAIRVLDGE